MGNNIVVINGTRSYNVPESWMGPLNAYLILIKAKATPDAPHNIVPRTLPEVKRTLPKEPVEENPVVENPHINKMPPSNPVQAVNHNEPVAPKAPYDMKDVNPQKQTESIPMGAGQPKSKGRGRKKSVNPQ